MVLELSFIFKAAHFFTWLESLDLLGQPWMPTTWTSELLLRLWECSHTTSTKNRPTFLSSVQTILLLYLFSISWQQRWRAFLWIAKFIFFSSWQKVEFFISYLSNFVAFWPTDRLFITCQLICLQKQCYGKGFYFKRAKNCQISTYLRKAAF